MGETALTLDQVAENLQTSREQVRQLCIRGKLPFFDIGTGDRVQYRIRPDDLDEFKKSRRRERVIQAAKALFEDTLPIPHGGYAVDPVQLGELGEAIDALSRLESAPADVCECGHGWGAHSIRDGYCDLCKCMKFKPKQKGGE